MQNNIPVFCPGLTDGSLGDMLYIHSIRKPGLVVDVVQGKLVLKLVIVVLVILLADIWMLQVEQT